MGRVTDFLPPLHFCRLGHLDHIYCIICYNNFIIYNFSYNVSDSTVDYFVAQGINVIYAGMAASASYDFIIDVSPPQVHFERKSFLKSDKLDFTFGKWTYYTIPFGGFKNGFKTKVRAKNGKLIEKIINLGRL